MHIHDSLKVLVGTGGWAYLDRSGDKLREYSKLYDFVEVNSTFYSNPKLSEVISWRKRVPKDFEFTVKCNRLITHLKSLSPEPESMLEVEYMTRVCRLLDCNLILLQTPPSLDIDEKVSLRALPLFESFLDRGVTPVLEVRGRIDKLASHLLLTSGVIRSVDLTKEEPDDTEILYSRLFGLRDSRIKGFTEKEYTLIEKKLGSSTARVAYLAFHGIQMYSDAIRFKERSHRA